MLVNYYVLIMINIDIIVYRELWDFIGSCVGDINQLTDSIARYPDRSVSLLKEAPAKRYIVTSNIK
jgi:hypothetical protein